MSISLGCHTLLKRKIDKWRKMKLRSFCKQNLQVQRLFVRNLFREMEQHVDYQYPLRAAQAAIEG
jgi:hypothetical protein